jgi:hypothetical protein
LLATHQRQGLLEAGFGFLRLREGLPQQELSVQPTRLGFRMALP